MKRSRQSSVAEKALRRAIDEETAGVRQELAVANRRIAELEGILGGIARTASNAVGKARTSAPPIPPRQEEEEPQGHNVELDGADNMGPGRWA